MTNTEFYLELNELVFRFLWGGGDPSILAECLREIADEVFEEPDDGPDQLSLWYDTSEELR